MSGGTHGNTPRRPRRAWRSVDGIVLLDKPAGLSSNEALQRVRRVLAAAKAGHAGTLDPMATGMLPLCFGQATKACGSLLGSSKAYRVRLQLGRSTDTGDARGQVTAESAVPTLGPQALQEMLAKFAGIREQVPPMYSALKHDGERLYQIARRGESVARPARRVELRHLRLLRVEDEFFEFEVECSKGTYIRVLGEELARQLGTVGHLSALRRLWVEPFSGDEMVSLEDVLAWNEPEDPTDNRSQAYPPWLLPVDRAFPGLTRLDLDMAGSEALRHGRPVPVDASFAAGVAVRAYDEKGVLLGLLTVGTDAVARVQRLFVSGAH